MDLKKSVKRKLVLSFITLGVGVLFLGLSLSGVLESDSLEGTLLGLGFALTLNGIGFSISRYKMLNNPEKIEEEDIVENDERFVLLREKTNSKIYSMFVYVECGACLLASMLGYSELSLFLAFLIFSKFVAWFFVGNSLSKRY